MRAATDHAARRLSSERGALPLAGVLGRHYGDGLIGTTSTTGVNVGQRTTLSSNTCPRVVMMPPWTYRSSDGGVAESDMT